jgi:hypothetical protein
MASLKSKIAQLEALGNAKGRKNVKKLLSDEVILIVAADGIRTVLRSENRQVHNVFIKVAAHATNPVTRRTIHPLPHPLPLKRR